MCRSFIRSFLNLSHFGLPEVTGLSPELSKVSDSFVVLPLFTMIYKPYQDTYYSETIIELTSLFFFLNRLILTYQLMSGILIFFFSY